MDDKLGRAAGLVDQHDRISARDVLEAAPDALVVVDDKGEILQLNAATAELFLYQPAELRGRPVETLVPERYRVSHVLHRLGYHGDLRRRPMGAGPQLYGLRKDGSEFPVEISLSPLATPRGTLVIAAIRDISARKRAEAERQHLERESELYAEISRLAQQDPLTGLPNRALLYDRLGSAIATARRHGYQLAVLFLDLDRFKQVNESLGHGVGDRLLEWAAERLGATVRDIDTVSRQGGDEFVILLNEVHGRDEVAETARKILGAVSGRPRIGTHDLHVTASLGIALFPEGGADPDALIKNADIAMYYAKDRGRDNFQFFADAMNARIVERQQMEGSLRGALTRGELVLYYQPKIALASRLMIGAEALLRWRHPGGGLIPPERFIPIAEDSGLIVPIGQWVLREACRQVKAWQEAGLQPPPIAVNISAIEFRSPGFLDAIRRTLDDTRLDPCLLELELTETVLMERVATSSAVLGELKDMGLGLTLDDFGTGYSSLSYLTQFPIDALKVDQSFVRDIGLDGEGSPIISAVISMSKSLHHRVIAEGVETLTQLTFLEEQRCEEAQGFHFSRPLEAERFADLLVSAGSRKSG